MIRQSIASSLALLLATACAAQSPTESEPAEKQPGETVTEAVQETPRHPTSSEVMYRVFAAEILGSEGDLQGAVGEYLEAAMESEDPEIARRATQVAFAAQAWVQAAMAADRWSVLAPGNLEAHESASIAMLAGGDFSGAELHMQKILQLHDDRSQAWTLIATLLSRTSNPEKAEKVLQDLLVSQGEDDKADALYAQSQVVVRNGDIERAFHLAEMAVKAEPGRADLNTWAGRLALNMNRSEAGMEYIEKAWRLEPDNHDLALAYADLLARSDRADEARQVMQNMDQTPDVMLTRVLFEISAGDLEEAEVLFDEFAGMEFEHGGEKDYFLAQAAEAMGDLTLAIQLYGQVDGGEHALAAGVRRAELMAREGDLQGALDALAILRQSDDIVMVEESWLSEARLLREAGDKEGAIQSLGEALEQIAGSMSIRYSHALLAAELGQVETAERDLRIILAEQPENAAALNALGYTLADQTDRYTEAESLIRRAFVLQPEDASIVDSMGWVAFRQGRLEEAEEYLRQAWSLDKNPEIAAHLGEVLWLSGKNDEAVSIWREGMVVDNENPVLTDTLQRLEITL
jgi:tetratricopeptide (TPR) repeat protein